MKSPCFIRDVALFQTPRSNISNKTKYETSISNFLSADFWKKKPENKKKNYKSVVLEVDFKLYVLSLIDKINTHKIYCGSHITARL